MVSLLCLSLGDVVHASLDSMMSDVVIAHTSGLFSDCQLVGGFLVVLCGSCSDFQDGA